MGNRAPGSMSWPSCNRAPADAAFVAAAVATAAVLAVQALTPADPVGTTARLLRQLRSQEEALTCSSDVSSGIDEYTRLHSDAHSSADERAAQYRSLVNSYYDLATLFYEWGWGQSFHFAHRHAFESFAESIRRHEYFLASRLNLAGKSGALGAAQPAPDASLLDAPPEVLDVGCGVGGPMRNIARFTGASVTGITLNQYQVDRGNALSAADRTVSGRCRSVQGDFMSMPFPNDSYDAAYAIEATCHAPNRLGVYAEIYRVLKPGAVFACYEWCMTDAYDPSNERHRRIKKQIEEGDGLPDICHTSACVEALLAAGFDLLEHKDMALDPYHNGPGSGAGAGKPWMLPLMPSYNPFTQRFQFNPLGYFLTNTSLKLLEFVRLAPRGTSKTQAMLQKGGSGLAAGGLEQIFTPMYLMVGRKPVT